MLSRRRASTSSGIGIRHHGPGSVRSPAEALEFIVLLALTDEGAPYYNHRLAAKLAAMGAPSFACTPDLFPDLMAAAIKKEDISNWASDRGLNITPGNH